MHRSRPRAAATLALAVWSVLLTSPASRAADVSAPVTLQWFETQWGTMERRTPDLFMAGYGAVWTPPPGRALYDDQGGGIGYNLYDRFDLGKAGDRTLYGTEAGYRSLIKSIQKTSGSVYVDYVDHHVGSWDVPAYNGWGDYTPQSWQHVRDRSDYPGFELSDPYVGANSFDPNYRNYAGHRDSYPDAPPVNNGSTPQFQYQYRLAHLITIDLTSGRSYIRTPVTPGDPQNIRQAPESWSISTSTLLSNNKVGGSTVLRQANTPDANNARFYPDLSLPGIEVTDPATGGGTYTIHPFSKQSPLAGDAVAETPMGYMMRYAQWLVNDLGVDGLRIDAARHVPYLPNDPYNPANLNVPNMVDRAVFRQGSRYNLDGTQRPVFSFQEVFTGDKGFNQQFVRKDINPATPDVVGGNRDVLDFPLWFAMRANLTRNGLANNWYNIRNASQDSQDDGLANNGSQSIAFVINHDDGRGHPGSTTDYIHLDNVAHAWVLTRPGNAYVYFNAHEFDRTGNNEFFLKDGRGDALGGQYGQIITKLLDIRTTHGRGDFQERWIDPGSFSNVYAYERTGSMLVGLNSALGTVTNFDQRTMSTSFAPGTRLIELTGNADDSQIDTQNNIPNVVTVDAAGQVTLRIPRNQNISGVEHGRGYVIYGLPKPNATLSLSGVSKTLAGETPTPATNATARLASIDVISGNSFTVNLNTSAVTLSDGYRDSAADGSNAVVRIDEGLDLNGNGSVDDSAPNSVTYGFEQFTGPSATRSPGYGSPTGNGAYSLAVDAATLSEGYHYLTTRTFRHRADNGPAVFDEDKRVLYVDRLPPSTGLASLSESGSGSGKSVTLTARSLDQTADNVHVFLNLGSALTDAQILSLISPSSAATQTDRDLFARTLTNVTTGTHALTVVTREITGNYSILRATGYSVTGGAGLGFGDLNADGAVTATDVSQFQSVLQSNNQQFHPAAEANTDGHVDLADTFLLGPRLASLNVTPATAAAYDSLIHSPAVTTGTYSVSGTHDVRDVTAAFTSVSALSTLNVRSFDGGGLDAQTGATVRITPGGTVSTLSTLWLSPGASFDLADNTLTLTDTHPNALRPFLSSGQLTSSVPDPNDLLSVGYVPDAASSLLVQLTYTGDANLDGTIDADDYTLIDRALALSLPDAHWFHGDFDYDGAVTSADYLLIDRTFVLQGAPLSPDFLATREAQFGPAYVSALLASVPEPASAITSLIAGFATLAARRRRP